MREAFFRFTTRRFIVLVAIVATMFASGIMVTRLMNLRAVYRDRATHHGQEEQHARALLNYLVEMESVYIKSGVGTDAPIWDADTEKSLKELMKTDLELQNVVFSAVQHKQLEKEMIEPLAEVIQTARSEIDYHSHLKTKYEQAATRPWLSVRPDAKDSGVDLWMMMDQAIQRSNSKYVEIDRLPLPPQLEIVEHEQSGKE
jgi:hypothetical protein